MQIFFDYVKICFVDFEKKTYSCVICGVESIFKICSFCSKQKAEQYQPTKPFPDPENTFEVAIARFITAEPTEEQGFDELAFSSAISHYMLAIFGQWFHILKMNKETNPPQGDAFEDAQVREDLFAQYQFLYKVLQFLRENESHIKEHRVINVHTLIPVISEIESKLQGILVRGDEILQSKVESYVSTKLSFTDNVGDLKDSA